MPNCTFLVRFGGISGEFGRVMVCILARRSRAKKVGLGINPNSIYSLREDDFHRVKMCQAFRSSIDVDVSVIHHLTLNGLFPFETRFVLA